MKKIISLNGIVLMLFLLSGTGKALAQNDKEKEKDKDKEKMCNSKPQYLYWIGGNSNDFFDEQNWRIAKEIYVKGKNGDEQVCHPGKTPKFTICPGDHNPGTDNIPKQGTIDPDNPIAYNLYVENADLEINSPLMFPCLDKGLTLNNAKLLVNAGIKGTFHLENSSTLRIKNTAFNPDLRISIQDNNSWAVFEQINPLAIADLPLSTWLINLEQPVNASALLINQYYQNGSVVRLHPSNYSPLTIYDSQGFGGASSGVGVQNIVAGSLIPGGLDNNIRSFKLKRGFMATLANNTNGTGKSQVFIASETDLEVPQLPASLSGNVSFIRVMPWNWVPKKGTGGYFANNPLHAGWFYTWSASENSKLDYEYVPMTWGAGSTKPSDIQSIIDKNRVTHLLGFNESDNCNGESGQYLNLCQPEVAVAYYERLMGSGLRLGTPAARENGPTTWLRQFAAIAKQRDVRFDFVAVHWYDWASNPSNSPNANPQDVFNRFKNYLTQVHNEYQLPIWITEFNANPNRENSVNAAFLQLALPYLESLPYVERYAYFQPNPDNASSGVTTTSYYFDASNNLTNIGLIYRDHYATASMQEDTYECPNNLDGLDQPQPVKQFQQYVFEAECGKYPGSKWTIGENEAASNGKYLQGNNQLAGVSPIATQVHFDIDVTEESNFRIWLRTKSTNGVMGIQVDHGVIDTIRSVNSTTFEWIAIPRLYSFKSGTHRVSLSFINNVTQFDQIAIVAGSENVNSPLQPAGYCEPDATIWGLTAPSAPIFEEAEHAGKGAFWTIGNNIDAIGNQFVESGIQSSPNSIPPASGWLTFSVNVTAAGAYQFWGKLQSLETTSDKLWVKIDNEDFRPWDNLQQNGYLWKWRRYDPSVQGGTHPQYIFLESGIHTFTIAYASGGVKIDRMALMPAGESPVPIDPDVIVQTGPQSFEAEEAQLIGTVTVANCATSSNGKQVNLGTLASNAIRFNNVLVSRNATYQLTIKYMNGGTSRNLRVIVNGTQLPLQQVVNSGQWCFNSGTPAGWVMPVNLLAGENVIELRPVATKDAPFIDKIEVRSTLLSMEAEQAILSGSNSIVNCTSASNGQLVNLGTTLSNSVLFNNIIVPATGIYNLNISYFSQPARTARMFIDNNPATIVSFISSGEWCFNNGTPVVKTVQVTLTQGVHSIRLQPNTSEAPLLDKIDLVDPANPLNVLISSANSPKIQENVAVSVIIQEEVHSSLVYPNPATAGSTIFVPGENRFKTSKSTITLLDVRGVVVKSIVQSTTGRFTLPNVPPGIYILRVKENESIKTYRIVVR